MRTACLLDMVPGVGVEATRQILSPVSTEAAISRPEAEQNDTVQKFDREDARLILRLMRENNFPQIWVPGPENRDLRQLLWHRHRLVQMRTRIMNQLQALAMNEGYRRKKKLFSEQGRAQLEKLTLAPWASRRRQELLEFLDRMNPTIAELTAAVERADRCRADKSGRLSLLAPSIAVLFGANHRQTGNNSVTSCLPTNRPERDSFAWTTTLLGFD